jgi:hypothetical protein
MQTVLNSDGQTEQLVLHVLHSFPYLTVPISQISRQSDTPIPQFSDVQAFALEIEFFVDRARLFIVVPVASFSGQYSTRIDDKNEAARR